MFLIYAIIFAILFLYSLDIVSFQWTTNIIDASLLILIVIAILDVITTPVQAKMKKYILCFIKNRGLFFYLRLILNTSYLILTEPSLHLLHSNSLLFHY